MNTEKLFPILGTEDQFHRSKMVPWSLVASHEAQCYTNHMQSVETLAKRGGLSYTELYAVLQDKKFDKAVTEDTAKAFVEKFIEDHCERTFIVPVEWTLCGVVAVKARTAEEACKKLQENNDHISVVSSRYGEYLDGSFQVPEVNDSAIDRCEDYTKEYENGRQFYLLNDL